MKQDHPLTLDAVRERLADRGGADFWRSLEELAGDPQFEELMHREFPRHAAEWPTGVDRRRFLQLAGASLALGGLTACTKQPIEKIVPYVKQPEQIIPGKPLYYASSMLQGGFAQPLLVESHMGRPTKVEGNPDHPAGTRSSDLFAQASVLQLYDPDRSQVVRQLGRIRSWNAFLAEMAELVARREALGEPLRLRLLTGTVTSPSLAAAIGRLLERHPAARWHQYEPVSRDAQRAAAREAFGEPVATHYDLSRARVVLSLDADFLTAGPGHLHQARDFMALRRPSSGEPSMSRLYVAESAPTGTGTLADHRLPLPPAGIAKLALAIAAELGVAEAAGAPGPTDTHTAEWARAAARDLAREGSSSVVIAGEYAPAEVHLLAHAMNAALGSVGVTVRYTEPVEARPVDHGLSLRELVDDMNAGEVDLLVIAGANPVYDAPADLEFQQAMLQVDRRVRLGLYDDETSEYCQWHLPEAHYLESWGDARAVDGTVCLMQPLIEPLHGGRSALEVVAALTDGESRPGDQLLREFWQERAQYDEPFEKFWRRSLHDGAVPGTAAAAAAPALQSAAVARAVTAIRQAELPAVEVIFRPDPTLWDGRYANNGWLQECPRPLTKLTWDNAALIGPALAARLGIENEEVVEVRSGDRALELPAWIMPGHPDGAVTVHLGSGRTRAGRVGSGSGVNAYRLRAAAQPWAAAAELAPTGRKSRLASTQLHNNIALESREAETRHLVRVGSLEKFRKEPDFAQHMAHGAGDSLYPPFEYDGYAWGLTVDLTACTGCNACVVACQAENNIPIVGKEQVQLGREMHWIRIDRYYQGDLDDPAVHHQPVMCMHCEQAPCEVVCPVAATVHSQEGLNDMVYNRCVGTRYCSNNCPYKVRRFNFLAYTDHDDPLLEMSRNPDVTVRVRGVMEKCTYCVQRINHARIQSEVEKRKIQDGEIVTACQQACPTGAIVFGDINDDSSAVARAKAEPRNYGILEELNTRPRTSYLAKIRNPNLDLEPAATDDHHGEESHA